MDKKVPLREKLGYGVGADGLDLSYGLFYSYLSLYLTNALGISSLFLLILAPIARLWDGINDPMMGTLVDMSNSKMGKYRPWILRGAIANAVVLCLLFNNPGIKTDSVWMYVYVAVFYVLWGMSNTLADIPYWSMVPSFTSDPEERDKIAVIPRIFATLGGASVNTFGLMLIGILGVASKSQGYFRLGIIISIIFVISTLVTVLNVKEKNVVENKDKIKISEIVTILGKNDQLLVIIASVVIFQVAQFLYSGFLVYFFTYAIKDLNLYATFVAMGTVTQVAALILFPRISKVVGRKNVYTIACILTVLGFGGMFIVSGMGNSILLCATGIAYNLGVGLINAATTVMISNAVDYGEYKLGKRSESIIFSAQTFIVKFSTAFSGLIIGFGLSLIKYVPNATQTASTIFGMKVIMFLIPATLMVICAVVYSKCYKLHGKFYSDVMKSLEKRREKAVV